MLCIKLNLFKYIDFPLNIDNLNIFLYCMDWSSIDGKVDISNLKIFSIFHKNDMRSNISMSALF